MTLDDHPLLAKTLTWGVRTIAAGMLIYQLAVAPLFAQTSSRIAPAGANTPVAESVEEGPVRNAIPAGNITPGAMVHDLRYPFGEGLGTAEQTMRTRIDVLTEDVHKKTGVTDRYRPTDAMLTTLLKNGATSEILGEELGAPMGPDSTFREVWPLSEFNIGAFVMLDSLPDTVKSVKPDSLILYELQGSDTVRVDGIPFDTTLTLYDFRVFGHTFAYQVGDSAVIFIGSHYTAQTHGGPYGWYGTRMTRLTSFIREKPGVMNLIGDVNGDGLVSLLDYLETAGSYGRHIFDTRTPAFPDVSRVDISGRAVPFGIIIWDDLDSLADILTVFANYGNRTLGKMGSALSLMENRSYHVAILDPVIELVKQGESYLLVQRRSIKNDLEMLERIVDTQGPIEVSGTSRVAEQHEVMGETLTDVTFGVSSWNPVAKPAAERSSLFMTTKAKGLDTLLVEIYPDREIPAAYGFEFSGFAYAGDVEDLQLFIDRTKVFGGKSLAAMTPANTYIESLLGQEAGIAKGEPVLRLRLVGDRVTEGTAFSLGYSIATKDGYFPTVLESGLLSTDRNKGEFEGLLPKDAINFGHNYPNPFNPATTIPFTVHDCTQPFVMELGIYTLHGQLVYEAEQRVDGPGSYRFVWDGRNGSGSQVATGQYFSVLRYRADGADKRVVGKLTLVK
ncbi:hypothetical protein JXB02_01230 [Candidatus Woesearchaeota archaeon]|nr:hypothetical protein [Candidatus Woesearchaeota archaeon]